MGTEAVSVAVGVILGLATIIAMLLRVGRSQGRTEQKIDGLSVDLRDHMNEENTQRRVDSEKLDTIIDKVHDRQNEHESFIERVRDRVAVLEGRLAELVRHHE